jgi:uncharacterized DUF497 family protein
MRFTWDAKKAATNAHKHGITFEEATTVFMDPLAIVLSDTVHRDRASIVGTSATARVLVTIFTEVREDTIRIISARRATRHERKRYESGEET